MTDTMDITEYLAKALAYRALGRGEANDLLWGFISFERLVQPGGPFFVLVAVADESAVFVGRIHRVPKADSLIEAW